MRLQRERRMLLSHPRLRSIRLPVRRSLWMVKGGISYFGSNRVNKPIASSIVLALMLAGGCASSSNGVATVEDPRTVLARQLERDVRALADDVGVRDVDHPRQAAAAAAYVEGRFRQIGRGRVSVQPYDVGGTTHRNVCLEVAGTEKPDEVVVVGAHYDTARGTPGADDNASGVSGVMELSRRFAADPAPRTVRFVAFGTEEPPNIRTKHMGSFHYARLCRERNDNLVAMMSVEMIGTFSDAPGTQRSPPLMSGYPTVGNFLLFVGDTSVGPLVRHSREVFTRHDGMPAEVMVGPRFMPGVNSSDQWSFWQWNYPGIMVTDTAHWRNANYHKPDDTAEKLNYPEMARAVEGLAAVLRSWAGGGSVPTTAPASAR